MTAMIDKSQFDIVIAGGGMVGASLALALARALPTISIAIVDRFPSRVNRSTDIDQIRESSTSFDGRSTVLSEGSRRILAELDVWQTLELHSAAITDIHVSERGKFGVAHLSAEEHGWQAMGYVVDNARLGQVLLSALHDYSNIHLINPATVKKIIPLENRCELSIDSDQQEKILQAELVVVADGADSQLRKSLGVAANQYNYQQNALIANVSFSKPHNGYAYERFTDWGPMALLPLPEYQGENRAALIWTMAEDRIEQIKQCSDSEFLPTLQQRFGYRQGRFLRVGQRHVYPLVLNSAAEQVRKNIVILGNAAHTLHPVAGQGFNLSLRDVSSLVRVLVEAKANQESIAELSVLQRYLSRRRADQKNTIGFSHQLTQLFSSSNPCVQFGRHLGLALLDGLPDLKSVFTDYAAGTAAWERA